MIFTLKNKIIFLSGFLIFVCDYVHAVDYQMVRLTSSCHDCDYIPKVAGAGQVFTDGPLSYQLMHNGVKVLKDCYSNDPEMMAEIIKRLQGHHEPQEEKVFFEVLKNMPIGAVMIELGSWWAYYSMWFNKVVKNATNYMIEPTPSLLAIGRKNFELNNMMGVFVNVFVGSTSATHVSFTDWFNKKVLLDCICIDDFIAAYNIPFVHILHSDIQGAEYDMLLGAQKSIISHKVGYVFLSTHGNKMHEKCLHFLYDHNFKIVAAHTQKESYSFDGLIVAKSENIVGIETVSISKRPA